MALSLGNIAIGAEGLYLGDILIGTDNIKQSIAPPGPITIDWLVVGAGGGGGFRGVEVDYYGGGAGGAGGVQTGSAIIQPNSTLEVQVGKGGSGATTYFGTTSPGVGSTLIIGVTAYAGMGGGRGGTGNGGNVQGGNGGSGGGGASLWSSGGSNVINAAGGAAEQVAIYGGFGQPGCAGGTSFAQRNGGGGGTSVAASNTNCPTRYTPGYIWLDGGQYAIGGDAGSTDALPGGAIGWGGNCNVDGSGGGVQIRYTGTPVATGGIVYQLGGYTYHLFTYSGVDPQYISYFVYNP